MAALSPFPWIDVAVIAALILLNALFAMSELAVVSARTAKLRAMARPRPVPRPTGLVVKKGSPARARISGLIPVPVSVTVTRI